MYKLLIIFIAGIALTAGAGNVVSADPPVPQVQQPQDGPHSHQGLAGKIEKDLNLTDSQKAQLQPILKNARDQFRAIHQDTTLTPDQKTQKLMALRPQVQCQINKILTPAQQQKLASMRAEMHQHHPDWDHNGPPPHPSN
jgi:Spy/CpxP family protein refolding chaperone